MGRYLSTYRQAYIQFPPKKYNHSSNKPIIKTILIVPSPRVERKFKRKTIKYITLNNVVLCLPGFSHRMVMVLCLFTYHSSAPRRKLLRIEQGAKPMHAESMLWTIVNFFFYRYHYYHYYLLLFWQLPSEHADLARTDVMLCATIIFLFHIYYPTR